MPEVGFEPEISAVKQLQAYSYYAITNFETVARESVILNFSTNLVY